MEPEDSNGGIPTTEDNPDPENDLETEGVMNMDLHLPDLFEPSQRNKKTKYLLQKRISCVRICVDVQTSVLRLQEEENRGKFKCNTIAKCQLNREERKPMA